MSEEINHVRNKETGHSKAGQARETGHCKTSPVRDGGKWQEPAKLPPIAVRNARVQDCVALREPDRVPFIPTINTFYATGYGVTVEAAMTDLRTMIPVMDRYLPQYDPDLVFSPTFFPIGPMEAAGYTNARWPGSFHNLPENTPYQYLDREYLKDDEYDDYLKDPTAFLMKKMLAKRYQAFGGLEYLNIPSICGQSIYNLGALAAPPVREAFQNMIRVGELVMKHLSYAMEVDMHIINSGYPVFGAAAMTQPFDDFADNVRGLLAITMDLLEDPGKVKEAVDRWGDVSIPAFIQNAKRQHAQYAFIPLHCGVDSFMSRENYDAYYWPPLKRMIEALVAAELTPVIVCEGAYHSRLMTLRDVPKGKVMYLFEDVDLKEAKKVLGDVACIGGGMPTQLLMQGSTPHQVKEQVKRVLFDCAPGGGFFMTNTLALDNVEHPLIEAWREALELYGAY